MKITKHLIPVTHLPERVPHGYANGYVGVPPEHPWYNQDYDYIDDVAVNGGLTYSGPELPGNQEGTMPNMWYVGFDVCHGWNNQYTANKAFCEAELENLYQQAIAAYEKEN